MCVCECVCIDTCKSSNIKNLGIQMMFLFIVKLVAKVKPFSFLN